MYKRLLYYRNSVSLDTTQASKTDASVKIGHKTVVKLHKLLLLPTEGTECFAGTSICPSVCQFGPVTQKPQHLWTSPQYLGTP